MKPGIQPFAIDGELIDNRTTEQKKVATARFRLFAMLGGKPKNIVKEVAWGYATSDFIPPERFVDIDDWQEYIVYLKSLVDNSTMDNHWKISELAQSYMPPHGLKPATE